MVVISCHYYCVCVFLCILLTFLLHGFSKFLSLSLSPVIFPSRRTSSFCLTTSLGSFFSSEFSLLNFFLLSSALSITASAELSQTKSYVSVSSLSNREENPGTRDSLKSLWKPCRELDSILRWMDCGRRSCDQRRQLKAAYSTCKSGSRMVLMPMNSTAILLLTKEINQKLNLEGEKNVPFKNRYFFLLRRV